MQETWVLSLGKEDPLEEDSMKQSVAGIIIHSMEREMGCPEKPESHRMFMFCSVFLSK